MTTRIKFFGVAGYEVVSPDHRILFDPYLIGNPGAPITPEELEKPDVILVSHAVWDHMGDAFAIAERTGAPVVGAADVRALMMDQGLPSDQVQATIHGIKLLLNGVVIQTVEAHHWSQATLSDGSVVPGTALGYVVDVEPGVRIYHWGDSAFFPGIATIGEFYSPTVAILGCALPNALMAQVPGPAEILTGAMAPRDAALAAELLGAQTVIASHYIEASNPDVGECLEAVGELDSTGSRVALAPEPGQVVVIDGERAWIEAE